MKHEHLGAGKERGVDLEGGILGRGADEHDVAGLDAGQEGVLLRLVEPVNLVDEDDRPPAGRPPEPLRLAHHLADFLDPRQNGAERHEARLGRLRDDPRERRLARPRRTPEDDRLEQVALDRLAQRFPGREQILLADQLVEGPRPHPLGQRRRVHRCGDRFVRKERVHSAGYCTFLPTLKGSAYRVDSQSSENFSVSGVFGRPF